MLILIGPDTRLLVKLLNYLEKFGCVTGPESMTKMITGEMKQNRRAVMVNQELIEDGSARDYRFMNESLKLKVLARSGLTGEYANTKFLKSALETALELKRTDEAGIPHTLKIGSFRAYYDKLLQTQQADRLCLSFHNYNSMTASKLLHNWPKFNVSDLDQNFLQVMSKFA